MNTKDLFYFSKGLGFKISKEFSEKIEENTSFSAYKIEGDIEIRISNHKTKLRTWLNNNKSNGIPQVCISIVCKCDDELDKIPNDTKLPDNVDFSVQQFIYDFRTFTKEDIKALADNINATFQNMSYPNNALPNGQHPSPEYVTKTDSKLIDKLAKKVKKRGGTIVHESFSFHIPSFEEFSSILESNRTVVVPDDHRYHVIGEDIPFEIAPGNIEHSIVTLQDNAGGTCHICEDDHCYVLYQGNEKDGYVLATHIFPEAFDEIKRLPRLQ